MKNAKLSGLLFFVAAALAFAAAVIALVQRSEVDWKLIAAGSLLVAAGAYFRGRKSAPPSRH